MRPFPRTAARFPERFRSHFPFSRPVRPCQQAMSDFTIPDEWYEESPSSLKDSSEPFDARACAADLLETIRVHTRGAHHHELAPDLLEHALFQLVEAWGLVPASRGDDIVDELVADTDRVISNQVNEVLHHPLYQELESAWLGLKFLVDRVSLRDPIKVQFLNASKEDLLNDFEDASEIVRTGIYFHVNVSQYGQFGGEPIGAVIGNYQFRNRPGDLRLLSKMSAVAAMTHAPFISSVDKSFFGITSWEELTTLNSLKDLFEMPNYATWNGFRKSEDARYAALTLPRFLLRAPYGPDSQQVATFRFVEDVDEPSKFCWGNAAFAFASRLAESFSRYHWCVNIVGEVDGVVRDLPTYSFETMGGLQKKIPLEVLVSEQREFELSEAGFVAMTLLKEADNCCFFSAFSCQAPKILGRYDDEEYILSYNTSRQLPYLFLITRLAHYIKVIQREYIGFWKGAQELQKELNDWVGQYVTTMSAPDLETRAKRPFSYAHIEVRELDSDVGWYTVELKVRPHFKYMGMNFTLSLTGKLDKTS